MFDSQPIFNFMGHFYWHGFTSIPAWISNYMPRKVCDESTYPFPNFNCWLPAVNSPPPSAAYMRQWTGSAFGPAMEKISMKFESKFYHDMSRYSTAISNWLVEIGWKLVNGCLKFFKSFLPGRQIYIILRIETLKCVYWVVFLRSEPQIFSRLQIRYRDSIVNHL